MMDSWSKGWIARNWTVADGQTLELRVDLVGMSESTSVVFPGATSISAGREYVIGLGRGYVAIGKLVSGPAMFSCDKTTIKTTNVVLVLALTRVGANLVVTARVLDKDNQEAVLYERSVVDTPQVDPTLTAAEIEALTGMRLQWWKDAKEPPLFFGDSFHLEIFQYTDGTRPAAEATYDNLEVRTYEIPQVGMERTVQLTWPAPAGMNYAVEGAPTVSGPWLPLNELLSPGLNQMTVPANRDMQFFRVR